MTARDHNKLLSIFLFIQGGIVLITGIILALVYAGVGTVMLGTSNRSEDQMVGSIFLVVSVVIGLLLCIIGGVTLFGAYKLLKVQKIGRILAIVLCILSLPSIPLGTALGVYGLWFLLGDMGKALYADNGMSGTYNPPPPENWR